MGKVMKEGTAEKQKCKYGSGMIETKETRAEEGNKLNRKWRREILKCQMKIPSYDGKSEANNDISLSTSKVLTVIKPSQFSYSSLNKT